METKDPAASRRQRLMGLFSKALPAELEPIVGLLDGHGPVRTLRGPETGMVLVRGRIGGGGSPFALGEVTVSRASVALAEGLVGHGHVLGGNADLARKAAIADALSQHPDCAAQIEDAAGRIAARLAEEDRLLAAETAATRVEFFTLVRGED